MVNVIILEDGKVCQQMSGDYATGAVVTQEDDLHVNGFLTGNCNTRFCQKPAMDMLHRL